MYDLILRGGHIVDPSEGLNGVHDVAVENGVIAAIAPSIVDEATQVVNVHAKTVTPGLIDTHTHVYRGGTPPTLGIDADTIGVRAGVTTVLDAGSAGCNNFEGFPLYVIPNAHTEIVPFLHIGRTGQAQFPDILGEQNLDLEGTERTIEAHRDLIKGIKIRMTGLTMELMGAELARQAKRIAKNCGIPLMMHIGISSDIDAVFKPDMIRDLLPILERGDILTHCFTHTRGGILDAEGEAVPEAKEALDRGVWFDVGVGGSSGIDTARRMLDQGLRAHCLGTDLTASSRSVGVYSFVQVMTRFMALGYSLEEVVTMATEYPAKAMGMGDRLGSLAVGRQADLSVLEIRDGDWVIYDNDTRSGQRGSLRADKALVPALTVKRGEVFTPEWGPRPWGWEPDPYTGD